MDREEISDECDHVCFGLLKKDMETAEKYTDRGKRVQRERVVYSMTHKRKVWTMRIVFNFFNDLLS